MSINLFFFVSNLSSICFRSDQYHNLHERIRNSLYYSRLPHLPIECIELDGSPDTLPIIIEEIYSSFEPQLGTNLTSNENNENSTLQTVQNLSKSL